MFWKEEDKSLKPIEVTKGQKCYKLITLEEINKAIIEAHSLVQNHFKKPPTIEDIINKRDKISKKIESDFGIGIPVYNVYMVIRKSVLKKQLSIYNNLLRMYSYAYSCLFDCIEYADLEKEHKVNYDVYKTGKKLMTFKEILDTKVDIDKLLDNNFIENFATFTFNALNNVGKRQIGVNTFLKMEKELLNAYKKQQALESVSNVDVKKR